jgi:hypothetical protein
MFATFIIFTIINIPGGIAAPWDAAMNRIHPRPSGISILVEEVIRQLRGIHRCKS